MSFSTVTSESYLKYDTQAFPCGKADGWAGFKSVALTRKIKNYDPAQSRYLPREGIPKRRCFSKLKAASFGGARLASNIALGKARNSDMAVKPSQFKGFYPAGPKEAQQNLSAPKKEPL